MYADFMSTAVVPSLRDHIAAEEAELRPASTPATPAEATPTEQAPAVAPAGVADPETPEQEADSPKKDADLSEAARALRKNRLDARAKRVRDENDELARELHRRKELRSELERESRPAQPRTAAGPAAGTTASERFAFPEYDAWAGDPANAGKPFGEYLADRDDARDAFRESRRERVERQTSQERVITERATALDALQEKGRAAYADFDAVVDVVREALLGHPAAGAIAEYFTTSAVGEDLVYRLGKHSEALKAVRSARNGAELARALNDIERQILAPDKASKPVTRTPAPPTNTVSASGSPASIDTTKPGTALKDHIRAEEAEIAERRRAGYRY